jgi:hypothetical protein
VTALLLSVLLAVEPSLQRALEAELAVPGARLQVTDWRGPRCRGDYRPTPFEASGRVPVRVRGPGCNEWGWATVRVLVDAAVLGRTVRGGDSLDGAWTLRPVEVLRGRPMLATIPPGATARRQLRGGEPVAPESIRTGLAPGTPVTVRVALGGIVVEQPGTVVPCPGPSACAVLPSGRRVAGLIEDGVLRVPTEGGRL